MKVDPARLYLYSAFVHSIFGDDPITEIEIKHCLDGNKLLDYIQFRHARFDHSVNSGHDIHIMRIAYLVKHGWDSVVEMDCTDEDPSEWFVTDGNHRLAAALYRKDKYIQVHFSGDMREIHANILTT